MARRAMTTDVTEIRFEAMGSDVHVLVVDGAASAVLHARARIEGLESRWSRFLPGSEISRLARADGRPVLVSPETLDAVAAAVEGWRGTDGRFDPTVLPAVVAAGYDRSFTLLHDDGNADPPVHRAVTPAPGCRAIVIDTIVGSVTLPPGTAIDLGGIGKGLAADLVAAELADTGAGGVCVNVGGDLRVRGEAPTPDGWIVDIEHLPGHHLALAEGGVATSSSLKRTWVRHGSRFHHLIDPSRGAPATAGLRSATVIAASAGAAEVLTKAAFVAGTDGAAEIIGRFGATGLLVTESGAVITLAGVGEYLR